MSDNDDRCQRCGASDAGADAWNIPLCGECFAVWGVEAPTSGEVEAKARPDQFHETYSGTYLSMRQLKPGLLEAHYRSWTKAWVARHALKLGRGAA